MFTSHTHVKKCSFHFPDKQWLLNNANKRSTLVCSSWNLNSKILEEQCWELYHTISKQTGQILGKRLLEYSFSVSLCEQLQNYSFTQCFIISSQRIWFSNSKKWQNENQLSDGGRGCLETSCLNCALNMWFLILLVTGFPLKDEKPLFPSSLVLCKVFVSFLESAGACFWIFLNFVLLFLFFRERRKRELQTSIWGGLVFFSFFKLECRKVLRKENKLIIWCLGSGTKSFKLG